MLTALPAAASNTYRFHPLYIEDGLSQSSIYDCFQDSRGFLWLATEDGLNRYDGYEFKIFRYDPTDQNSLNYSYISRTCEDNNGGLWIGTFGQGLNLYDYRSEQFTHYMHSPTDSSTISNNNVLDVFKNTDGTLWVATSYGLNRLDPDTGKFHRYIWAEDSDGRNDIRAIEAGPQGKLWLGTGGAGVALFDPADGSCRRYVGEHDEPGARIVVSILDLGVRGLWFGTEHGLYVLDATKAQIGPGPRFQAGTFDLAAVAVNTLAKDHRGDCWVGTVAGLVQVDGNTGDCTLHVADPFRSSSLSDNEVSSLLLDRSHVLWVGTRTGLSLLDLESKPFNGYASNPIDDTSLTENHVRCFLEEDDGDLWVGAFGGLDHWDRKTNTFVNFRVPTTGPHDVRSNRLYSLAHADSGLLWVGTSDGAYLFDKNAKTFRRQGVHPSMPGELSSEGVRVIHIDRRGDIWFGTSDGLNRLVLDTGTVEQFRHDPDAPATSLCNDLVYTLAEDVFDNLWVGTVNGLSRLSPDRREFTNYYPDADQPGSISSVEVLSLLPELSGVVWVGTSAGLNRYDNRTDSFSLISVREGLPNDTIYAIVEDDSGYFWVSTNHGLARIDPRIGAVRAYDHYDGLLSDEFNLGAGLRLRSGELAFGNIRGFNLFYPDRIQDNELPPELVFTDFKLFNRSVVIGEDSPLISHISTAQEITLSHQDYVFSFEFAALHFAIPEKNRYATMLEGMDEDWVDIGTRRVVAYNNLPPGDYVFRVKAANGDGAWNNEGISVNLKITPPFWQRAWFRVLIAMSLLGLAWLVVSLRIRAIKGRNLELEQKVAERTDALERANHAKSDFLANMSHEIRTPLNCVIGMADLMKDLKPTAAQEDYLDMIQQSGTDLLSLINDILDLSKVEADQLELDPLRCDLPALCEDVLRPLETLAEAKDLDLILRFLPTTPRWVTCDPLRLRQVIVNLVNNAIKFTDSGEIVLEVDGYYQGREQGRFVFRVIDSGLGIEQKKQRQLFEKFTQADASTTRKYGGTGLGLAISKQLVELMGSRLEVQSELGSGATFSFSLVLPTDGISVQDLPAKEADQNAGPATLDETEPLSLRILVAEDNVFNQTVARHLLEHMGCTVDLAKNGRIALEMSASGQYDAILMDCQMPEMDGYEATRQIRQREAGGPRLTIVAMTANAMAGDREKCLAAGMDGYLPKPVVKSDLAGRLREIEREIEQQNALVNSPN